MIIEKLKRFFSRDEGRDALYPLYQALVKEARDPSWYLDCAVPDTIDGRFDMLGAVLTLALQRFDAAGDEGKIPAVMLTETFIEDMDGQLRQDGVGDVVVGKHVGRMLSALGGRLDAYGETIHDPVAFKAALVRNLYRSEHPGIPALDAAANRLMAIREGLSLCTLDQLMLGQMRP
jgi:cytochrome b pre-mRNA-processing protein 3